MSSIVDHAYACVKILDHCLDSHTVGSSIDIPKPLRDQACKDAIAHHHEHLIFCKVDQQNLDAYKFMAWYGWALLSRVVPLEEEKAKKVSTATILALDYILRREPKRGGLGLCLNSRNLLRTLVLNEWMGSSVHGIGKNGLYAAFHCAAN